MALVGTPPPAKPGAARGCTKYKTKRALSPLRLGSRCGVSCCATEHNGLSHVARPVATLRCAWWPRCTRPPLCLAPLRGCAPGQLAAGLQPVWALAWRSNSQSWCGIGCAEAARVAARRFARLLRVGPRPPAGPLAAQRAAPGWPVHPPRGFPPPGAQVVAVLRSRPMLNHPNFFSCPRYARAGTACAGCGCLCGKYRHY